MLRIGLIADTHGLWDARVPALFKGVSHIIHAGDVGAEKVVEKLERIAPVTVVKGNTDVGDCAAYPEFTLVVLNDVRFFITHILGKSAGMRLNVAEAIHCSTPDVVVYGHTHQHVAEHIGQRIFINPGSAGPRRFLLPRTVAEATFDGGRVTVDFHDLDRRGPASIFDLKVFDLERNGTKT